LPSLPNIARRLRLSIATWPDRAGWRDALLLTTVWAAVAVPLGIGLGVARWEASSSSRGELLAFAAMAIVIPSLAEEILFRALLIPHRSESVSVGNRLAWAGFALAVFVAYHPLNGWLLKVSAATVFTDPGFLTLAALLGVVCTLAYWRTGSIWPAVGIHWLTVVAWKVCLGGRIILVAS